MKKTEIPKYTTRIFWHENDQCFFAICPELQDLSAFGDTQDEALAELHTAIELVAEAYDEKGWPLPEPCVEEKYSGQFRLRLSASLHRWLAEDSKKEGVSLNSFVVQILAEAKGAKATSVAVSNEFKTIQQETMETRGVSASVGAKVEAKNDNDTVFGGQRSGIRLVTTTDVSATVDLGAA